MVTITHDQDGAVPQLDSMFSQMRVLAIDSANEWQATFEKDGENRKLVFLLRPKPPLVPEKVSEASEEAEEPTDLEAE